MNRLKRIVARAALIVCALACIGWQAATESAAGQQAAPAHSPTQLEAVRENNFGVSLMNRQQFDQALVKFRAACALGPKSAIACVNVGIALFNLQKYDEARAVLAEIVALDPQNARAWFTLGLIDKAAGEMDAALADFDRVTAIDPGDADSEYFRGFLYSQQRQYDKAMAAFRAALERNPFHVSAEFGLAQAEQRSGDLASAKEHLANFQRLTTEKLGVPIGSSYGEQGNYSLAAVMTPAPGPVPPAIPVHFAGCHWLPASRRLATRTTSTTNPFSCQFLSAAAPASLIMTATASPTFSSWMRTEMAMRRSITMSETGKFVDVTRAAGLNLHGVGTGCAVGDYDNDGKPDLAVGLNGRVLLFHNEGNGTFKDVTEKAGIKTEGLTLGMTFVDYDHDGDLDLYVTRFNDFPLADSSQPFAFPANAASPGNVLWRNNGNGTFTDSTSEAGTGRYWTIGRSDRERCE